jgi:copper homeostasis protein
MMTSVRDVRNLTQAAGVVFGILRADKTIDYDRMKALIDAARPMKVVCHKAFDETPDWKDALDTLILLGMDGVLTSGHSPTAVEGALELSALNLRSYGRI